MKTITGLAAVAMDHLGQNHRDLEAALDALGRYSLLLGKFANVLINLPVVVSPGFTSDILVDKLEFDKNIAYYFRFLRHMKAILGDQITHAQIYTFDSLMCDLLWATSNHISETMDRELFKKFAFKEELLQQVTEFLRDDEGVIKIKLVRQIISFHEIVCKMISAEDPFEKYEPFLSKI